MTNREEVNWDPDHTGNVRKLARQVLDAKDESERDAARGELFHAVIDRQSVG